MNIKILMILGMHRSGTSLVSNWLQKCGLHIGEDLAQAAIGNVKGQFEDVDFVKIHNKILRDNRQSYDVILNDCIKCSIDNKKKIERLISTKSTRNEWGWKDPRTCIFLDVYQQIIPDCKVLVVYRNYTDVVDSLIRRFVKIESKSKRRNVLAKWYNLHIKYKYFKKYSGNKWLKVWIRYNHDILKYLENKDSNDFLIVNINDFPRLSSNINTHIIYKFGFSLKPVDFNSIVDLDLIQSSTIRYSFDKKLVKEANKISRKFEEICLK